MSKKVVVGMSGGVDSSVAAILLKEQGYDVIGLFMRNWDSSINNDYLGNPDLNGDICPQEKDYNDAIKVCEKIGIPLHRIDFVKEYWDYVFTYFLEELKQGRTPNPDIMCNKYIKFDYFLKEAKRLGADYIATGHYAKIEYSEKYNQYVLRKSNEVAKDQTYFLYTISKEKLEHIIFPLQEYLNKQDTRKVAEENGLEVAYKKDSQEICFIPDNDYQLFLKQYGKVENKMGNIVLQNGGVLGHHSGLVNYTIGQRKGLGVSYKEPLYVIKLDKQKNEVIVGSEKDLYSKVLYANEVNWIIKQNLDKPIKVKAKVRYRAKEAEAIVYEDKKGIKVEFTEPQRAITPGQSVVFYDYDGIVLGGGKITINDAF